MLCPPHRSNFRRIARAQRRRPNCQRAQYAACCRSLGTMVQDSCLSHRVGENSCLASQHRRMRNCHPELAKDPTFLCWTEQTIGSFASSGRQVHHRHDKGSVAASSSLHVAKSLFATCCTLCPTRATLAPPTNSKAPLWCANRLPYLHDQPSFRPPATEARP